MSEEWTCYGGKDGGQNTQRLFTAAVVGGARDSEVIMNRENLQESLCVAETPKFGCID